VIESKKIKGDRSRSEVVLLESEPYHRNRRSGQGGKHCTEKTTGDRVETVLDKPATHKNLSALKYTRTVPQLWEPAENWGLSYKVKQQENSESQDLGKRKPSSSSKGE